MTSVQLDLVRQLLLARVDRSGAGEACWPWTGRIRDGYGEFDHRGKVYRAARVALELKLGRQLGRDEVTRHSNTCTTRACCRPDHLQPGSAADNVADRHAAGRTPTGARHWKARLTPPQVVEILRMCVEGTPKTVIAARFGVGREAISKIARGENWRCVPQAGGAA